MSRKYKKNRKNQKPYPVIISQRREFALPEDTSKDTEQKTQCTNISPQPEKWFQKVYRSFHSREWLGVLINAVLVIFTYRLYSIAVDQADSAKISAEAALKAANAADSSVVVSKQSMRISNRAYLFAESLKAKINHDHTVTIDYSVKNYGNSPARKTKVTIGCSVLKTFTDTLAYHASDTAEISFPIPPGKTVPYTKTVTSKISEANMKLYNMDSVHVYVYGEIIYIDMFGDNHHSPFCGEIIKGKDDLIACPGHNDIK